MTVLVSVFCKKHNLGKASLNLVPATMGKGRILQNLMIVRRNMKASAMILGICFLIFKHSGLAAL